MGKKLTHDTFPIGVNSFAGPGGEQMIQLTPLSRGYSQLDYDQVVELVATLEEWLEEQEEPPTAAGDDDPDDDEADE